jgi:hypothetical protein
MLAVAGSCILILFINSKQILRPVSAISRIVCLNAQTMLSIISLNCADGKVKSAKTKYLSVIIKVSKYKND